MHAQLPENPCGVIPFTNSPSHFWNNEQIYYILGINKDCITLIEIFKGPPRPNFTNQQQDTGSVGVLCLG